ncbi:MAG: DNA polymerase III subunit delta' [Salinarimonas sp.]
MVISKEPETDQLSGAPHPRERHVLYGQDAAEQAFLAGFRKGKLHHAWLIGGMQGIGKATLAYRIARFVLAYGHAPETAPDELGMSAEHPVVRQVAALSHPDLFILRRVAATEKKAASTTIPVEQVRKALHLFSTTAAASGYRICIVDSAEDLAGAGANALLKMVEEPPPRSLFLIIAHEPRRVLPTIRSRCRRLDLQPLTPDAIAQVLRSIDGVDAEDPAARDSAIARAEGSARRAFELLDPAKREVVETMERLLENLPREDFQGTLAFAEKLSKKGSEEAFSLALETMQRWASAKLHEHAARGARRLAPLVEVCDKIARSAREADIYNLDRRPLVLTMFGDLAGAVRALD